LQSLIEKPGIDDQHVFGRFQRDLYGRSNRNPVFVEVDGRY